MKHTMFTRILAVGAIAHGGIASALAAATMVLATQHGVIQGDPLEDTSGLTTPLTPVLDINISSSSSSLILEWSSSASTEIWRSINGAEFSLLTTVTDVLTYTDSTAMDAGELRSYKVRTLHDGVYSGFSNTGCAVNSDIDLNTDMVSHPDWMLAFGDFGFDDITRITSLSMPTLRKVSGMLYLDSGFVMSTVNLDSLVEVGGTLHGSICSELVTLNLPSLQGIGGDLYFDNCAALTNVSLPDFVLHNGQGLFFDSSGLSAASVNHILARAVASNVTGCTITLDGGANAAPTGQGIMDKATLIALGNRVSTN